SQAEAEAVLRSYAESVPQGDAPYEWKEALASLKSAYGRPAREPWKKALDRQASANSHASADGRARAGGGPEGAATDDDRLVYRQEGLALFVTRERKKWRVVVVRGEDVLGAGILSPAAVRDRRELLRSLQGTTDAEAAAVEKALLRLADQVER